MLVLTVGMLCQHVPCWHVQLPVCLSTYVLALQDVLAEVRAERRERAALGAPAPYTRIYY